MARAKQSKAKGEYKINVGDRAPRFAMEGTGGTQASLESLRGRWAVLYFYPKDNTSGCALEGDEFAKLHAAFKRAGAEVFGVSADSVKSHEGFKAKRGFPFELLSDPEKTALRAFDSIQLKSMYGRTFEGIERSTFVIDPDGVIRAAWRKVKAAGHAAEVLTAVKELALRQK